MKAREDDTFAAGVVAAVKTAARVYCGHVAQKI